MSIPGLGQAEPILAGQSSAPTASSTSTTFTVSLKPFWEYRFEVSSGSTLTIRLLPSTQPGTGTALKDGTELASNIPYVFQGTKAKIDTLQGCELEVTAPTQDNYNAYVAEISSEQSTLVPYINLHMKLSEMRSKAAAGGSDTIGPRVMVVGSANSGKSTLVKTLAALATKMGHQPLVVNTDPSLGMLCLPGSLSAAVFATLTDITSDWGETPTSAPSATPIKLPLVFHYGFPSPDDNPQLYKDVTSRLAKTATRRLKEDDDVRASGMLIDTIAVDGDESGSDLVEHLMVMFLVNIVIVLGADGQAAELKKRFEDRKTPLGEDIHVVELDKSSGVAERDAKYMQTFRESAIREYFFGNAKRTLSPHTMNLDFDDLVIWKVNKNSTSPSIKAEEEDDDFYDPAGGPPSDLEQVTPSVEMINCTLVVVRASPHDSASVVRDSPVMGCVYVANVDVQRRRLKILTPVITRLNDTPLVWGSWPERVVSLVG